MPRLIDSCLKVLLKIWVPALAMAWGAIAVATPSGGGVWPDVRPQIDRQAATADAPHGQEARSVAPRRAEVPIVKRQFTVRDAIEMVHIEQPIHGRAWGSGTDRSALFSPDKKWAVIVTSHGDIEKDCVLAHLNIVAADAIRLAIRSHELLDLSNGTQFCSSSNTPAISLVKWRPDSAAVTFLGERRDQLPQVFALSVEGRLTQITHLDRRIVDYDAASNAADLIARIETPADWTTKRRAGYVVTKEPFAEIVSQGYVQDLEVPTSLVAVLDRGKKTVPIAPENWIAENSGPDSSLWMSPNGRFAVAIARASAAQIHKWQASYRMIGADRATYEAGLLSLYYLVDTHSGHVWPLINAPIGYTYGGVNVGAIWSPDSKSVAAINVFRPLPPAATSEEGPSILSVKVPDLMIASLFDIPPALDKSGHLVSKGLTGVFPDGDAFAIDVEDIARKPHRMCFRYRGRWQASTRRNAKCTAISPIALTVREDLNTPPEILASDATTGTSAVVTDLNPQFRSLDLGSIERIEWKDKAGTVWRGGLLKPTNYVAGHRYPLVIQTHGFDPHEFFMDGPYNIPSGYAGRELANRGIAVLQVDDDPGPMFSPAEPATRVRGYIAAIAYLDRLGVIDKRRVGIHGFSRSGFYVQNALTFSGFPFSAASVSDASNASAYEETAWLNHYNAIGASDIEKISGGSAWSESGRDRWLKHDPALYMDRIRTPILIQNYTGDWSWLDVYAQLTWHHRPAEYMSFPGGAHVLVQPLQRLHAQETVVDWDDFWLNAHEDPNPAKRGQYARWEKLCDLQIEQVGAGNVFCVPTYH